MIKIKDTSRFRSGAFLSAMNDIKDFVAQEDAADLGITAIKEQFSEAVERFTNHFKNYKRGSEHTETIALMDFERDETLIGFSKHITLYKKFPEADKAQAAKDLYTIIKKYGKAPHKKPLEEETGVIIALLKELSAPDITQKIALIGATPWITALQKSNTKLSEISQQRTSKSATIEAGTTKAIRMETYEVFKKLVHTINSLAFINDEDKYKRLIDRINEVLKNAQ